MRWRLFGALVVVVGVTACGGSSSHVSSSSAAGPPQPQLPAGSLPFTGPPSAADLRLARALNVSCRRTSARLHRLGAPATLQAQAAVSDAQARIFTQMSTTLRSMERGPDAALVRQMRRVVGELTALERDIADAARGENGEAVSNELSNDAQLRSRVEGLAVVVTAHCRLPAPM